MKFNPTTRGNACQICGDVSGRCRTTDTELHLCMGVDQHGSPPGFRFIGFTKDKLWAKFIKDLGAVADPEEWQRQRAALYQRRELEESQRRAASMPAQKRDRYYRQLLEQLTLDPEDRADLHRRGLSDEEIKAGGFKSVKQWQRLEFELPSNLPGVNLDGRSLNVGADGYLCPILDVDGLIVSFQIRLRASEGGRYRWLSSRSQKRPNGAAPNLPNGELPLAVFRPEKIQRRAIALVEGTGPKPFITSQRLGVITIGAAGGQFASSPEILKATLEKLGIEQIQLFADAGAVSNPNVVRQYQAAWEPLEQWGYSVQVGWWNQLTKADPDIDELEDPGAIAFISPAEFLELAGWQPAAVPTVEDTEAIALDKLRYKAEVEQIMAEFNTLRIQPTISASGDYIPPGLLKLPEQPGVILTDGAMGTRKTSVGLKGLVEEHRRRFPEAFRSYLSPRNALGRQAAKDLGLPHHTTFKGFGRCPNDVTLCPESGWRFPTQRLPEGPPLIFMDEVSQLLNQVLEGKTSKQNHALILSWLRLLLKWVKEQGGWIVLAEDGLTNLEIDLICEASELPVVEFLKFERTVHQGREIVLFKSASLTWKEIKRRLDDGENLVLASDSARWLRQTQRMAIAHGIAPEDIYIVDGETSSEPWAQELSQDPDQWIAKQRPRLFGYSPSFQQGISMMDPTGHFHAMGIHLVHLDWRSAKQMPERLRTNVPRFGYVKERGIRTDESFSSCRPDVIIRDFYRNFEGIEKLTQFAQYAQSKEATDADGNPLDLEGAIARLRESQNDPNSDFGFWLRHYARYQARANYNRLSLRDSLIELWQSRGYNVQIVEGRAKEEAEERKRIQADLEVGEASTFAALDASNLTVKEARETLESLEATKEQRDTAHKRLLEDKLPGVDLSNPEFILKAVIKDNGRFIKTAELLWMSRNPKAAQWLDRWTWKNEFDQAARRGQFVSYAHLSWRSGKAKLLNECPLEPFIDGKIPQWDNNTPEAIAVHQWALMRRRQFWRYLQLTIKEEHSAVTTVNKLLRKLGYQVEDIGWKGSRKDRERQYIISNLEDADREAILKALEERFIKRLEDKEGITDPASPPSVIATQEDLIPLLSCDHAGYPDWSFLPPDEVELYREAWQDCETDGQRREILNLLEAIRSEIA